MPPITSRLPDISETITVGALRPNPPQARRRGLGHGARRAALWSTLGASTRSLLVGFFFFSCCFFLFVLFFLFICFLFVWFFFY